MLASQTSDDSSIRMLAFGAFRMRIFIDESGRRRRFLRNRSLSTVSSSTRALRRAPVARSKGFGRVLVTDVESGAVVASAAIDRSVDEPVLPLSVTKLYVGGHAAVSTFLRAVANDPRETNRRLIAAMRETVTRGATSVASRVPQGWGLGGKPARVRQRAANRTTAGSPVARGGFGGGIAAQIAADLVLTKFE